MHQGRKRDEIHGFPPRFRYILATYRGKVQSVKKRRSFSFCVARSSKKLRIFFFELIISRLKREERNFLYISAPKLKNHLFIFIASGATGMCQLDRVFEDGLNTLIQRIQSLSYHYDGRLELHVLGGYADSKAVSHTLSIALLRKSKDE